MMFKKETVKMRVLVGLLGVMIVFGCSTGTVVKAETVCGDSMNDVKEAKLYSEKSALKQEIKKETNPSLEKKESMELREKIVNGKLTQKEFDAMLYSDVSCDSLITHINSVNAKAAGNDMIVDLKVKQFEQANGYYCGPATTRQTLYYLLKTAPTQKQIAQKIGTTKNGTDGTKIVEYLNKKQNKHTYLISNSTNKMDIQSRIVCALNTQGKAPVIARLKFKIGGHWRFNTEGHYLNVTGYNTGMTKVKLVDPNITRAVDGHSGSYVVNFTELHQAIKDHWAHHIYW